MQSIIIDIKMQCLSVHTKVFKLKGSSQIAHTRATQMIHPIWVKETHTLSVQN